MRTTKDTKARRRNTFPHAVLRVLASFVVPSCHENYGQPKIDVGTVAALGVAFGAIMGAVGAIATGLAGLATAEPRQ